MFKILIVDLDNNKTKIRKESYWCHKLAQAEIDRFLVHRDHLNYEYYVIVQG